MFYSRSAIESETTRPLPVGLVYPFLTCSDNKPSYNCSDIELAGSEKMQKNSKKVLTNQNLSCMLVYLYYSESVKWIRKHIYIHTKMGVLGRKVILVDNIASTN